MSRYSPMTLTLLALLAGVVPAGRGASPEPPAAPALKQAFTDAFLLGTAVNDDIVSGRDARAQALVPRHFNAITLENSMKAEVLNPRPGEYDFAAADAFVAFGEQHGMFIVGHTLVWHNQTPEWFFKQADGTPVGREALAERMRQYIEAVAGRYAGRVDAWDVVNEQIGADGRYRDTTWSGASAMATNSCAWPSPMPPATRRMPSCTTTTSTPGGRRSATASCAW